MRKAVLDQDNRVIDLVVATEENAALPDAGPTISIGCYYVPADGSYLPPPAPPEAPIPIPNSVSRFQARAALFDLGLLDAAEAITEMAGGKTLLAWKDATEFFRDSPSINGLAPHLGLDENQIDELFKLAATIRA